MPPLQTSAKRRPVRHGAEKEGQQTKSVRVPKKSEVTPTRVRELTAQALRRVPIKWAATPTRVRGSTPAARRRRSKGMGSLFKVPMTLRF